MTEKISNSERYRRERAQQVEDRRAAIIDAATELFLEKGLEQTTMLEIANHARISKVTLYRYFPDRHPIAFEVSVQMLKSIVKRAKGKIDDGVKGLGAVKGICLGMISEFPALRGAYRYIGMFDNLYGEHYPSDELEYWYKQNISNLMGEMSLNFSWEDLGESKQVKIVTLFNMIMSFLEKMAARGELMGKEQEVSLRAQLEAFEEIVIIYLNSLEGE